MRLRLIKQMIPRGKLDISYADFLAGFGFCLQGFLKHEQGGKNSFRREDSLVCLSVRSGFDLVLQALNLPPGSEILVTDISIPGMFQILAAHQIRAIPLAVNKHNLSVSVTEFEAAITESSKAAIFTHLFGGLMNLSELNVMAKAKGLLIIEDCAQAYIGNDFAGKCASDIRMFSFGMIKTNTALSGALLYVRDAAFCEKLVLLQQTLPQQSQHIYFKKLCLAFAIKLLTTPFIYALFYWFIVALGRDADDVLSGFTRGFPGANILEKIRFRPGFAIRRMIDRRLRKFRSSSIDLRRAFALEILASIPDACKIGAENEDHSFWVLPLEAKEPELLINLLRSKGFDATSKASSLVKMPIVRAVKPDDLLLDNLVYLPMWPRMSKRKRAALIAVLNSAYTGQLL